ncbi:hypothetical protein A2Y99_02280 [Candidatus Gottesmanbacteria bacterium RBG_13_37_7]|uniref:Glycosyl transferase family 1 domain-containing protein n=1 Tax=Candidatus Gottesmanbacteria bacterium RBG_13_37_7 TaxID=1798369 RepID=A0A1F5YJ05_9BACT|nr:MAG: hypothetical protein A2Y99_02280 [Candidatus Gottesmanbacteria bacterium RBG_13_37_7]
MHIAIFNWRDIKNPKSGGAEIVTQKHARGWVKAGHRVTLVCPAFRDCKWEETIDRVQYVRLGIRTNFNYLFIYFLAFIYYHQFLKGKVDLVIDEIHGLPFFTPLYVREKKLAFICEVAGEIWDKMFPKPLAFVGRQIENYYFSLYKKIKFLTISQSTKRDLIQGGIIAENITVIYPGVNINTPKKSPAKEKNSTLIWLNRINKMKNLKDAILAFNIIQESMKNSRFIVAGKVDDRGYYKECQNLAENLGIKNKIRFLGFVDEQEKMNLLSQVHLLLHTSVKEGWGINVLEANLCQTPAVSYNVEGLRETVKDSYSGLLCIENNPSELAKEVIGLLQDKKKYSKMQENCLRWARKFTWEKAIKESLRLMENG